MHLHNQSGRSMVEMLGVLAIIGVLSIGGVVGYRLAMERYIINSILYTASTYASHIYIGRSTNKDYTVQTPEELDLELINIGITVNTENDAYFKKDGVELEMDFGIVERCQKISNILSSPCQLTGCRKADAPSCIVHTFKQS